MNLFTNHMSLLLHQHCSLSTFDIHWGASCQQHDV